MTTTRPSVGTTHTLPVTITAYHHDGLARVRTSNGRHVLVPVADLTTSKEN